MEKVLLKLARQLNAYDEASLMAMWDKYAAVVQHFEPTKRWEEAALVFSLIQAVRWKNQLFNYHWSEGSRPRENGFPMDAAFLEDEMLMSPPTRESERGPGGGDDAKNRGKVLRFRPREGDEPV